MLQKYISPFKLRKLTATFYVTGSANIFTEHIAWRTMFVIKFSKTNNKWDP